MEIKGSLILVTGASSGIGEASARLLASAGGRVIMLARTAEKLERISEEIRQKGGETYVHPVDLGNAERVSQTAGKIKQVYGIPDVILNCAGAGNWLSVLETTSGDFYDMIVAPYLATTYTIDCFVREMTHRNTGHIITLNSAASYFTFPGALGYLAARWALRGYMEGLTEELRFTGVRVTSIVAGKVDSPYFTNNPVSAERIPRIATGIMKTLTVDEVAQNVVKVIRRPKKRVIIPWQMAWSVALNRYFPTLFRALMRKTGYRGIPEELANLRKES